LKKKIKADFTYELLKEVFFRVVQSYKYKIISGSNSSAKVQIVRISRGSGRRKMEESEKKLKKTYYVRKLIGPKLPKSWLQRQDIVETVPVVKKIEKQPKTRVKHLKKKQIPYFKLKMRVIKPFNYSYLQKNVNRKSR
jgi:hypothetical protein